MTSREVQPSPLSDYEEIVQESLYLGNREPALDEVLGDPIVRLVMARDRLPPGEVRAHVEAVAARLVTKLVDVQAAAGSASLAQDHH